MKKGLLLSLIFLFSIFMLSSSFAADRGNKIGTHVFEEKGMRHSISIMQDPVTGKKAVIDTIMHCNPNLTDYSLAIANPSTGLDIFPADTCANWFWFASDTAEILEIHAQFALTGTGSWNAWPRYYTGTRYLPATQSGQLLFDVPWTIAQADTDAAGAPTQQWQVLDLVQQGMNTNLVEGTYVGYYTDASAGPRMFMDSESDWGSAFPGHPFEDWLWSRTYSNNPANTGWWIWWNGTNWYEYVMRIVVKYERVAPTVSGITSFQDYFEGNTALDVPDKTVSANIIDLDGTVAGANLRFTVTGSTDTSTVAMTNSAGDTWEGDFGVTFSGGEEVEYWIEATDDQSNLNISASRTFSVVTPPTVGTNVLIVAESAGGREVAFETALSNLSQTYHTWNASDHGGISSYEINYGFDAVLWTGFGTSLSPSPYGTDATGISTFLDNGGNFIVVDMDYLWIHGWGTLDTLAAGDFGYDYLGLYIGSSDPVWGDTVLYGQSGDPVSSSFLPGADSITVSPIAGGGNNDWSDGTIARAEAYNSFYTNTSMSNGFYSGVLYKGSTFTSLYLPWSLETAPGSQIETVLGNFFTVTSIDDPEGPTVVNTYQLDQNYPNPFNPTTKIAFSIKVAGNVELNIYNALGQKVRTLVNKEMAAGTYNAEWNGVDANGNAVASGIYIYELKSGDFRDTHKMLLIK